MLRVQIQFCNPVYKLMVLYALKRLNHENIEWDVLKASKELKLFKQNECFSIFVSLDRTVIKEREETRKLVAEVGIAYLMKYSSFCAQYH